MKKALVLALALLCGLCGCSGGFLSGVSERTPAPGDSMVPVPPTGGDVSAGEVPVTLYYRYQDEPYLAAQSALLPMVPEVPLERALLELLIAGPEAERADATALIDTATEVIDVVERDGTLEITLSDDFVPSAATLREEAGAATPEEVEEAEEAQLLRRLAVYSIVNTIAEMGKYSRVMILVQGEEGGLPEKLTREQAGFEKNLGTAYQVEPLARDTSLILTASAVANIALEAVRDKDWARLYAFIAVRDVDRSETPALEDVRAMFADRAELIDYRIQPDETVSADGNQVTLNVTATFMDALNNLQGYESIALRLVRQGEVWMVAFSSLDALLVSAS